jgi:hypothetical protein
MLTYGLLPLLRPLTLHFGPATKKALAALAGEMRFLLQLLCFCIQKSVLQYEQEGTAHLAVNYLEEVPVERSYARQICCMLRRWPSWTYEGNRGCQASGFVQFPFKNGIRILQMPRTNAWPVPLGKIL